MKKVLTTTQYNIEQYKLLKEGKITHVEYAEKTGKYAKLMATSLELGMFTPCVDEKPIEEPNIQDFRIDENCDAYHELGGEKGDYNFNPVAYEEAYNLYKQAKKQVLFDGDWYITKDHAGHECLKSQEANMILGYTKPSFHSATKTIEDLARQIHLKSTEAFMKKFIPQEAVA